MKRLFKSIGGLTIALAMLLSFIAVPSAHAVTSDDSFFGGNDIDFFDPAFAYDTTSCSGSSANTTGSATTITTLKKSDKLEHIFQTLVNGGMNAVQAAAVMGNMYHESGFNPDQHEIGNDIGYGLAQWSFGRRDALEAYAKAQGVAVSDLDLQLSYLLKEYKDTYKSSLQGSQFDKGAVVKDATKAWMMVFEVPAMQPANDPAALYSARVPAANTIYGYYKDLTPNASDAAIVSCDSSANTAVAGSIVDTALAYAWPAPIANGKISKGDARTSYQQAKDKWNPDGAWSDCGVFVATVMRSSGVDPDYVLVSVAAQTKYVEAHPDKYKIIKNPSLSDLQPGDIFLSNAIGHTTIYIGSDSNKGGYPQADASLGQRVPSLRPRGSDAYMIANGAIVARFIGNANKS